MSPSVPPDILCLARRRCAMCPSISALSSSLHSRLEKTPPASFVLSFGRGHGLGAAGSLAAREEGKCRRTDEPGLPELHPHSSDLISPLAPLSPSGLARLSPLDSGVCAARADSAGRRGGRRCAPPSGTDVALVLGYEDLHRLRVVLTQHPARVGDRGLEAEVRQILEMDAAAIRLGQQALGGFQRLPGVTPPGVVDLRRLPNSVISRGVPVRIPAFWPAAFPSRDHGAGRRLLPATDTISRPCRGPRPGHDLAKGHQEEPGVTAGPDDCGSMGSTV